jgi:acetyl-CoA carboxylase, biotin carboxylase subunit
MFRRILIANRGEIALRVIRACHELGVEAVAVYSQGDEGAPYLQQADEAICIGPPPSSHSYLDIPRILSAAEVTDVEAIHPGYGFLSERAHFAEVCEDCGITFIGPPSKVISDCGDKANAKALALAAGVPVVPGSDGIVPTVEEACEIAAKFGYPVIVKATAGGGGRGMRVAHNEMALRKGYVSAQAEAAAAFDDGSVYLEKFVENPRHIEIQILAGADGKVVHLGERDCSVQRRHQKLIEEAPSPALSPELRAKIGASAVAFAEAAGYRNAGTVEFLLDKNGDYFFMELNARIQVEHCVTEMVSGVDLVQWQLRVAAGESLDFTQEDIKLKGHAIEFRINAENPDRNFAPTPGKIEHLLMPGGRGVRIDSHICAGYEIPRFYDSMICKLISYGADRDEAIRIGRRALRELQIEGPGISTTKDLHLRILDQADFVNGQIDTSFLEKFLDE